MLILALVEVEFVPVLLALRLPVEVVAGILLVQETQVVAVVPRL